jgi:hypothetical protein
LGHFIRFGKAALTCWDLRSGDRIGPLNVEGNFTRAPALSPDGKLAAFAIQGKPKIEIWSLADKKVAAEIELEGPFPLVSVLEFAGPSRLLVAALSGKSIQVYDSGSGAAVARSPPAPQCQATGDQPWWALRGPRRAVTAVAAVRPAHGEAAGGLDISSGAIRSAFGWRAVFPGWARGRGTRGRAVQHALLVDERRQGSGWARVERRQTRWSLPSVIRAGH